MLGRSIFCLRALNQIPISVAYAIWSGAGIVLVGLVGWIWFGQKLDLAALVGMGLIICGVIIINLFSKTAAH
jgi:small multidrug resistance pump